jgi:uncharacterized protein
MEYLSLLALAYVLLLGLLIVFQRSLMYFPDQNLPLPPDGATLVSITGSGGLALPGWYKAPASDDAPVYLWFHGNAGNLSYFWDKAVMLTAGGAGLLLPEYRGYGGAPGKPNEADMVRDGQAAYDFLIGQGISADRIVIYGLSLGTGIATQAAAHRPARALVLEAPFSSTLDVAQWRFPIFPIGLFMQDTFNSVASINERGGVPLLIVHGTADVVVPYRFGERLFEAAEQPKQHIGIEGGGHVDLFAYEGVVQQIIAFAEQQAG